jgi:two-component system KDP operon response regulator KdpE
MKSKVLVVDDEASIRKLLGLTLGIAYEVVEARDGREGLHFLATEKPDLILIDMGLPDRKGMDVLKDLRGWSEVPVIILSVENDPRMIIEALDSGADDYITKPFRSEELLARIRVCLRRQQTTKSESSIVHLKHLEIDLEKRIVKKGSEIVHLTATEYSFLVYLLKNKGKVVTHSQILKAVWGPQVPADSSYPRVYMRYLRQKLEEHPEEPEIFMTETGVGYRMLDTL